MHTLLLFRQTSLPPASAAPRRATRWLRMLPLLALLALLGQGRAWAQASAYTFAQSSGTYTPITTGGGAATITASGTSDDSQYQNLPLGFTFTYNGVAYTTVSVDDNGSLRMGATSSSSYTPLSSASLAVSAFGRDLNGNGAGAILTQTTGTAPNRKFTVQWSNYQRYLFGSTAENLNFQIVLNESSNVINLNYGACAFNPASTANTNNPQAGLTGATTTDFNARTSTTDWAATTAGATNAATVTFSATVFPASGLIYTFSPPPQAYASNAIARLNTGVGVAPGSTNQAILRLAITTTGFASPLLSLTSLSADVAGSTDPSTDIANAHLYYTGSSPAFSTANLVATVANPGGAYTFSSFTQALSPAAVNYFFIAYDIDGAATPANVVSGNITGFDLGGVPRTVGTTTPATGTRPIVGGALAGNYTIDNTIATGGTNFNSFSEAITALNTVSPVAPVTFTVTDNQIFTELTGAAPQNTGVRNGMPPAIIVTGTASAPITFVRSNPAGSAATRPTLQITGTASTIDGALRLVGSDYVTFDGLNITQTGTALEYGYALFRGATDDGCQNNTIRNSTITLDRVTNVNSAGVFGATIGTTLTAVPAALTPVPTVASATGTNSNNRFYNLTIANVRRGIVLNGFSAAFPDAGNDVGGAITASTGNSITNFATFGIDAPQQSTVRFNNNTVNNTGGPASTLGITGISTTSNSVEARYNTITLTQDGSFAVTGLVNVNPVGTQGAINLGNNVVTLNVPVAATALSGNATGINNSAPGTSIALSNNTVTVAPALSGAGAYSGTVIGITNSSASGGTLGLSNNSVTFSASVAAAGGTTGSVTGITNSGAATGAATIGSNTFVWSRSGAGAGVSTGAITALSNSGTHAGGITISNNTWGPASGTATVSTATNTSLALFISNSSSTPNVTVTGNTLRNITRLGNGSVTGYTNTSSGTGGTQTLTGNTISNITMSTGATAGTGTGTFLGFNIGGFSTTQAMVVNNNTVSTIETGTGAITGIASAAGTAASQYNANTVSGFYSYGTATGEQRGISITGGAGQVNGNVNVNNLYSDGNGAISGIFVSATGVSITNNTVSGITSNGATSVAGTLISGIRNTSAAGQVSGNSVTGVSVTGLGLATVNGISTAASAATPGSNVFGNTINTLSGKGTVIGLGLTGAAATSITNAYGHSIYDLSSTTGAVYGVYVSNGSTNTANVYQNKVYGLGLTGASGTISGLYVDATAASTVNAYNNLIGLNGQTSASTLIAAGPNVVSGMTVAGAAAATVNLSFNTVNLEGSSSSGNLGSSGVFASTATPIVNLRNNLVHNLMSPGTGTAAAYRRGAAPTPTNSPPTTNNNNLYYAATPSATNVLYVEGTTTLANAQQTLVATKSYLAGTSGGEQNSVSDVQVFLNTTTGSGADFLHLNTGTPTQIESGGVPVAGITADYDNVTRNTSTPDIGADEGAFTPKDVSAPSITYTALTGTASTANRTLVVTITDATGVESGANAPRIYYRKGTSGAYVSAVATTVAGSSYTFTLDYSLVGGVAAPDVIQYYVAAQDVITPTPNGGSSPSGSTSINPPGTAFTGTPNQYSILPTFAANTYVGTTVGPYGTPAFATLTAAAAAYNSGYGISGATNFILVDNAYTAETYPIVFGTNADASAVNAVTIKPYTGISPVFSGTSTAALIRFNQAKYITLDGSNSGGASRNWTLTNTATTTASAVLWVASNGLGLGSTNITLKNLVLSTGSNTATTYAVALSGATVGSDGADNDNITLNNNDISTAYYGIYASGSAAGATAGALDGLVVSGNLVGPAATSPTANIGQIGIFVNNANNAAISQNNVRNVTAASPTGISLTNQAGTTVSNNVVSDITATGTTGRGLFLSTNVTNAVVNGNRLSGFVNTTTGGYGSYGIHVATATASSNVRLSNNVIYDFSGDGWSTLGNTSHVGIYLSSTMSGVLLYYNTVSMAGTSVRASAIITAALGVESGPTALTVRNNIFATSFENTATPSKTYAIYSVAANTAYTLINHNDYYVSGVQGVLGFFAAADVTTLPALQALATGTGQDANSKAVNPLFTSASNLKPLAAALDNSGTPIAGITTDFVGATRSATTPDIGAYEFAPPPDDAGVVSIDTPVSPFAAGSQSISVTINNSGTTTLNSVTLTYVYTPNGGTAQTPVVQTFTLGTPLPSTFPYPTASLTFGTPLSVTGLGGSLTVTVSQPNGVPDANAANNAVTRTLVPALNGLYTVGATPGPANFLTLDVAVATLNSAGAVGPVTFSLTDATYPATSGITLNQYPGGSSTNTLLIKPAAGISPTLTTTAAATFLLKLNGADYVTLDGSNTVGGTTRNLSLTSLNTAAGSAVVWLTSLGTGLGATNNTVKNVTITGGSVTSTTAFGIYVAGTTLSTTGTGADNDNLTIENNAISKAYEGVYARGVATTGPLDNLQVLGNTIGAPLAQPLLTVTFRGVDVQNATTPLVSRNVIFGMQTTASISIAGIDLGLNTAGAVVSRNRIHSLRSLSTSGYGAYGINISSATSVDGIEISNNMIADLLTYGDGIGTLFNPVGIRVTGGAGQKVYYNTVNLTGALTGVAGDTHAFVVTAGTVDLRNNVLINSVTGPVGSNSYALYATSASLLAQSNYNDYYVSGAAGKLGYVNGNVTTLPALQAATTKDANSVSAAVVFTATPTDLGDLHVDTDNNPAINNKGTAVSVTVDIDNTTRSATTPDLGADEFTPVATDVAVTAFVGPVAPFAAGSFPVSITVTNTGTSTVNSVVLSYTFNSVTTNLGTVTTGFPLAPGASTNVSIGNLTFTAGTNTLAATVTNPNGTAEVPPADAGNNTLSQNFVTALCGTYAVGTSGTFPTLDAAVTALNAGGATCAVVFSLTDATYPATGGITVNQYNGNSSTNTLTIRPATGVTTTLTSTAGASFVLNINGADYVTVNGSNNATTTRDLTLTLANPTGSTVVLVSSQGLGAGATNATLRNLNLNGAASTNGFGISAGAGAGAPGADNDNLTIANNSIERAFNGIYVGGSTLISAGGADGLSITGNLVGPATAGTGNISGTGMFLANLISPAITGNTIRNIVTGTGNATGVTLNLSVAPNFSGNTISNVAGTTDVYGLRVGGSATGGIIARNNIVSIAGGPTGGWGGHGIDLNTGIAASNLEVSNNMMTNISGSSWTNLNSATNAGNTGIRVLTTTGGVNLYYNSVSLNGTSAYSSTSNLLTAALYVEGGATALNVRNNIFANTFDQPSATAAKQYAFYSAAANTAYTDINYNDYYVAGAANVLGFLTADLTTLTALQTATAKDANSVSVNPVFASATDAHIDILSSAVNGLATPIAGITQDIDTNPRNATTPDLGADEYTPATGDVGVIALLKPAATNCYGGTQPVEVVIRNYTATATYFSVPVTVTVTGPGGPQTVSGTATRFIPANDTIHFVVGSYVVNGNGSYTFSAATGFVNDTNTGNNALAPVAISVTVPDAISIAATPGTATTTGTCSGSTVTLTASSTTGYTYTWATTTGGVLTATSGASVTANPTQSATYTVTGVSGACSITQTINIVVNPLPSVTLSAAPATVCANSSTQLTALNVADAQALKITEVTLFRTGTGATPTYPAYIPAGDQDFVEISNVGTGPVDLAGITVEVWTGTSILRSFTYPAATTIPSQQVSVINLASGSDSPADLYFTAPGGASTSGPLSSGNLVGVIIKRGSTIIDAVGVNGYAFPVASGVTAADFTGNAPGLSGQAGTIRTGANDTNDGADFTSASSTLSQTIGTYDGGYTLIPSTFTYSYSSPSGGTLSSTTAQNPTFSATTAGNFPISVTTTNTATGCQSIATTTITVTDVTTWTGNAATGSKSDWFNPLNWTNCLPSASINAVVPAVTTPALYPILTTGSAVAKDLTISGAAVVTINNAAASLDLKGNLVTASAASLVATAGAMTFSGTAAQNIGAGTFFNVAVSGAAPKVLTGNVLVAGSFDLTNGMLNSNGFELRMTGTANTFVGADAAHYVMTNGSTGRVRFNGVGTGGRASVTFPIGTSTYTPATVTNTGTLDFFTGSVANGITSGPAVTSDVVGKTWEISEGVAGGSVSALTLQWNAADELSGFNRNLAAVAHFQGGNWNSACYTCFGPASGSGPYSLTRTGLTSFSPFAVQDGSKPLPVELTRFEATRKAADAQLDWTTASERNSLGFDVQVSTNGREFRSLGFVAGAGTSNGAHAYRFLDTEKNKAGVRYYRLRQLDTDGTASLSPVRTVAFDDVPTLATRLLASPNPFQGELTLTVDTRSAQAEAPLSVTDASGRLVLSRSLAIPAGSSTLALPDLERLPAGVYLLHLPLDGKMQHVKVVKQ